MRQLFILLSALIIGMPGSLHAQDQYLSLDDVTVRYEVAGSGPAVVLLHGWAVSLESWHYLFPALSDGYTVIRYDRRGFGKSGGSADASLDPIDLRNLLDTLEIDRAVVIGHSQGSASALRFALAFPERLNGLVLFGGGPPQGFGLPFNGADAIPVELLAETAREQGLDSMWALLDGHPMMNGFVEGSEGFEIATAMFGAYEGGDLLHPEPSANATPPPDVGRLSEIVVPTLVITGAMEMPYFQIVSDAVAYGIANAQRVVVPGGGHVVMLQQPDRFNSEIKDFLAAVYR